MTRYGSDSSAMKRSIERKTVIPMPPATKTYSSPVSSGSRNEPFGSSTCTSSPTSSSASVCLKAVSRSRVASPTTPRSVGEVASEMWRRRPFSSSWPRSGSSTQKYAPGR